MRQKSNKQALDARKRLISTGEDLACPLTESQIDRLLTYLDLLMRWNRRIRLVGSRDPDELVDVHLTDAIALAGRLRAAEDEPGSTLIDVGSGAGLPGMVLAVIVPGIRFTLCETAEKRVTFLEEARRVLDVSCEIAHTDALSLERPGFDHAVARAVFAPERWREVAQALVAPTGTIWLMLTEKQLEDWRGGGEVFRYCAGGDRQRALVALTAY